MLLIFQQTYALAMYKNQHFDSELRIAAYRAIMTCPSENIMAAIQEVMLEEQSEQGIRRKKPF